MAATKILTGVLALASLTTSSLAHNGHDNATSFPYTLVADYSESNFFDGFVTFTGPDPTHGKVNYTDMAFAANQGYLAYTYHEQDNMTRARIGVDNVSQAAAGRNSVRLTSRATFNAGTLLVADINHIPVTGRCKSQKVHPSEKQRYVETTPQSRTSGVVARG